MRTDVRRSHGTISIVRMRPRPGTPFVDAAAPDAQPQLSPPAGSAPPEGTAQKPQKRRRTHGSPYPRAIHR
ncbi:hypothetical protein CSOJ01_07031 [Colletotrichum sojae]|uniref:Uncharacterized protein n=1 Tax=Colletotrichum sojae TaxID=2175907 RepID=A0A8H6JAD5_9PEZI|nr:hypothetical protein CSOJ01_07031 [Colletotrichum sojae]